MITFVKPDKAWWYEIQRDGVTVGRIVEVGYPGPTLWEGQTTDHGEIVVLGRWRTLAKAKAALREVSA